MKSLTEQLATYKQQHTNRMNRLTHYFGIPMIIFSLLMLLNWISIDIATKWQISFAWIFLIGTLAYYFFLNVRLAVAATIIMIPVAGIAMWMARPTPTAFSTSFFLLLFIGGWALQFLGHYFEKQKPAFFLSAQQLLIGPLFVLLEALEALGVAKYVI
ncbi:MAG: putative membrane spanning protein [uncultured bacterium]|nr:MAG: putative membrane spanning protein [uncultured bacterium]